MNDYSKLPGDVSGIVKCAVCGREIRWAITENGKRMPVEAGVVTGLQQGTGKTLRVFESHFANCENYKRESC